MDIGDDGKIAITYVGSESPGKKPENWAWNAYITMTANALAQRPALLLGSGQREVPSVAHRCVRSDPMPHVGRFLRCGDRARRHPLDLVRRRMLRPRRMHRDLREHRRQRRSGGRALRRRTEAQMIFRLRRLAGLLALAVPLSLTVATGRARRVRRYFRQRRTRRVRAVRGRDRHRRGGRRQVPLRHQLEELLDLRRVRSTGTGATVHRSRSGSSSRTRTSPRTARSCCSPSRLRSTPSMCST